jgi:flagellar basal-body rod protein FlgB
VIDRLGSEFNFLQTAVALRQQRMELLSTNIANADTPNYKARDFDFKQALEKAVGANGALPNTQLALTSKRHLPGMATGPLQFAPQYRVPYQVSMDGNTVEMDVERMAFADNTMKQQASLQFVTARIQSLMNAMSPTT